MPSEYRLIASLSTSSNLYSLAKTYRGLFALFSDPTCGQLILSSAISHDLSRTIARSYL